MRNWIDLLEQHISEGVTETLFRKSGGTIVAFDELPKAAQKALHAYLGEYHEKAEYTSKRYGFALIPAKALVKACWNAPDNDMKDDFASWEEYAEWYWNGEDDAQYANHLDEMWPVILDDGEGILDGWHRFHWYLRNHVEKIPAILFTEEDA